MNRLILIAWFILISCSKHSYDYLIEVYPGQIPLGTKSLMFSEKANEIHVQALDTLDQSIYNEKINEELASILKSSVIEDQLKIQAIDHPTFVLIHNEKKIFIDSESKLHKKLLVLLDSINLSQ
ncbi:hypothetical protein [Ekhidna sp.]